MRIAKVLMVKVLPISLLTITLGYLYLDRGLEEVMLPADFTCLKSEQGYFSPEQIKFNNIYGVGLAYANHINEIAADFNPDMDAPIFKKNTVSVVNTNSHVTIPTQSELLQAVEKLDPSIGATLKDKDITLLPLLDYEAEMAFVLLESITDEELNSPGFIPKIGFLVTNDLSARGIAILGEGQVNRHDYWGVSKSHPGFFPVNGDIWIPNQHQKNAIPCVTLTTYVDDELRQKENTRNLVYTPAQMIKFVHNKYPASGMNKGDIILTGTPGGVTLNIPRWKSRLATLIGLDRFQKLAINQKKKNADAYLKAGDEVQISAEWLGGVNVAIVEH